jgi:hypothetical protein
MCDVFLFHCYINTFVLPSYTTSGEDEDVAIDGLRLKEHLTYRAVNTSPLSALGRWAPNFGGMKPESAAKEAKKV